MALVRKAAGNLPAAAPRADEPSVDEATVSNDAPMRHTDEVTVGEGRKAAAALQPKQSKSPARETGSPLLDATLRVATAALDTRIIDEPHALALADRLDRAKSGFETRLVHMLLERAATRSLIGKNSRQRLVTSITAAFGRTGEKFSAARSPAIDSIGLPRGDQGFVDVLLTALRDPSSSRTVEVLASQIKSVPSAESLQSALDALGKVFATGAFGRSAQTRLLASVLRAQANLKATVIPMMAMQAGGPGLFQSLRADKLVSLSSHEKDALLQRIAFADLETLTQMRAYAMSVLTSPLFPPSEYKAVIQHIDSRLLTLRASA